jgi:sec-independent protein translocase protein TatC
MAKRSKDLFDDSVMTFGEHLESLRGHAIKALIGVVLAMILCLYKGDVIVGIVRAPLDNALRRQGRPTEIDAEAEKVLSYWEKMRRSIRDTFGWGDDRPVAEVKEGNPTPAIESPTKVSVDISLNQILAELNRVDSEKFPAPPAGGKDVRIPVTLDSPIFKEMRDVVELSRKPVTMNVQEGFMTYLKLSSVAGLIVASPWVFYQVWMFVAAGLYTHERKYVYGYGGFSLSLFLVGVVFCYYLVFPVVLQFLVGFNADMGFWLQARFSEWISFAIVLPLMFGLSFQLPLVMLFLERLQIFDAKTFTEQRRMAILIIAIISMVLTPADPISMLLMMFPLIGLYELGILMCRYTGQRQAVAAT